MAIAYFNRFAIELSRDDASIGSHQGACDDDIAWLRTQKRIDDELCAIDPSDLREELREYGAWNEAELADHSSNLDRILWLACGNILDEQTIEEAR